MNINTIHLQDCVKGMQSLASKSVDIIVTSPPYNLNIGYGTYNDNKPRQEYLDWLSTVFCAMNHCLKDDGHLWLNMGYSNRDPWIGMDVAQVARKHFHLQNNINWVKSITIDDVTTGHFKPINSDRYLNPTWEHLFHFTKNGDVKCDKLSIGVPYMFDANIDRSSRIKGKMVQKLGFTNIRDFNKNASDSVKASLEEEFKKRLGKRKPRPNLHCRGNSWYIPYDTIVSRKKNRGDHPATFPVVLVQNCVRISNKPSGILLDPFMGSGTSAIGAIREGLNYIGFDIDQNYRKFALNRIKQENENGL